MTFETIVIEDRGAARWIRLNRPAALNTLTMQMIDELSEALDDARRETALRALVLTGNGRAFCAGADLKAIAADGDPRKIGDFLERGLVVMRALETFPRPVIAAVNGIACGGGLEYLLCCDLVIAARDAKLGDAHANFGIIPGGGGSVRLPRRIGLNRALYLMFTGEFLAASEFVACGLVNEVVDLGELEFAVARLIAKLESKSPLGLARMKRLALDALEQPIESALRSELAMAELHFHSADGHEGLAAFSEKRTPRFVGR